METRGKLMLIQATEISPVIKNKVLKDNLL